MILLAYTPQPSQNRKASAQAGENHQNSSKNAVPSSAPANAAATPCPKKAAHNKTFAERHGWNYYDAIAPQTWSNWGLVAVGIGAIIAAMLTLGGIRRQTNIAEGDLIISSRAFLGVLEPENATAGEVRIPIENRGRVLARILTAQVTLIVHQLKQGENPFEIYRRTVDPILSGEGVLPGPTHFSLLIRLPEEARRQDVQFTVVGAITYEIGFKRPPDALTFVRTFSVKHNVWMKGFSGMNADFRAPEETKQQKQPN